MSASQLPAGRNCPRLTTEGALVLATVFLTVGPTVSFALGIPVNLVGGYVVSLSYGVGLDRWGANGHDFWANLLMSPLTIVFGLPFYAYWAETHLLHVAGWISCAVIMVATSRRGLRVRDTALIAAGAVLAFPFLVGADSPLLTWNYPDAMFMALPAAGSAALCVLLVRGFGEAGLRRHIAAGWLA